MQYESCKQTKACVYLRYGEGDDKGVCTAGPKCIVLKSDNVTIDTRTGQAFHK